jgi:DNA-binding NarL/FixJ family response regulator
MLRIVIVDDHAIVRHGIKQILADELEIDRIAEAGNADDGLKLILSGSWDMVILDMTLPGRSGLELLKDIRDVRPDLPVLVLSMHPEDQLALRVIKAGASGYQTKDSAPDELVKAVKRILAGGKYVSPEVAERMVLELQGRGGGLPHESLSDREFEVMRLIATGSTVSDIAVTLSLSVKTVSTYRARVLQKLDMRTNADLTQYAIKNELLD